MSEQKKILIVEDEPKYAKMVKMRLESAGYRVAVALDTYAGTQAALHEEHDLIILDLMMPAGGGFALLERIRKFPDKAEIPVVILTGKRIDEKVKAQAEANQVATIFTKPYDSARFLNKIQKLLLN